MGTANRISLWPTMAQAQHTVSIRLGDGMGGFSGSPDVSVASGPYSVAIGDFNGDGKQDLAVANLFLRHGLDPPGRWLGRL